MCVLLFCIHVLGLNGFSHPASLWLHTMVSYQLLQKANDYVAAYSNSSPSPPRVNKNKNSPEVHLSNQKTAESRLRSLLQTQETAELGETEIEISVSNEGFVGLRNYGMIYIAYLFTYTHLKGKNHLILLKYSPHIYISVDS